MRYNQLIRKILFIFYLIGLGLLCQKNKPALYVFSIETLSEGNPNSLNPTRKLVSHKQPEYKCQNQVSSSFFKKHLGQLSSHDSCLWRFSTSFIEAIEHILRKQRNYDASGAIHYPLTQIYYNPTEVDHIRMHFKISQLCENNFGVPEFGLYCPTLPLEYISFFNRVGNIKQITSTDPEQIKQLPGSIPYGSIGIYKGGVIKLSLKSDFGIIFAARYVLSYFLKVDSGMIVFSLCSKKIQKETNNDHSPIKQIIIICQIPTFHVYEGTKSIILNRNRSNSDSFKLLHLTSLFIKKTLTHIPPMLSLKHSVSNLFQQKNMNEQTEQLSSIFREWYLRFGIGKLVARDGYVPPEDTYIQLLAVKPHPSQKTLNFLFLDDNGTLRLIQGAYSRKLPRALRNVKAINIGNLGIKLGYSTVLRTYTYCRRGI